MLVRAEASDFSMNQLGLALLFILLAVSTCGASMALINANAKSSSGHWAGGFSPPPLEAGFEGLKESDGIKAVSLAPVFRHPKKLSPKICFLFHGLKEVHIYQDWCNLATVPGMFESSSALASCIFGAFAQTRKKERRYAKEGTASVVDIFLMYKL